jgi:hypothetical protein
MKQFAISRFVRRNCHVTLSPNIRRSRRQRPNTSLASGNAGNGVFRFSFVNLPPGDHVTAALDLRLFSILPLDDVISTLVEMTGAQIAALAPTEKVIICPATAANEIIGNGTYKINTRMLSCLAAVRRARTCD